MSQIFATFDHLLSPVIGVNAELKICYFNQAFSAFFKLPPRKLKDKMLFDVLSTEDSDLKALAQKTLETKGENLTPEIKLEAGGEKKEVVLKFFTLAGEAPDSTCLFMTIQDFSIERILHEKHRQQLDELKAKNAEIKKYSEGLEVLVDERTKELKAAKDETESILRSIREGLVVVMPDLCFSPTHSLAAPTLLGVESLSGLRVPEVLLPKGLGDKVDAQRTKVEGFLGSAFNLYIPDQFDDLLRYAPTRVTLPSASGGQRILSLSYSAVLDNDTIARIVIAVRDDTELEALRQSGITIHKRAIEALSGLTTLSENPAFHSYIQECTRLLGDNPKGDIDAMFRALHTIKGGARQFGLEYLQHFAHEAESHAAQLRDQDEVGKSTANNTAQSSLSEESSWVERGLIALAKLLKLHSAAPFERRDQDAEAKAWRASVETIKQGFVGLSQELGKRARLSLSASQPLFGKDRVLLDTVLTHLLRNALDHGVETPSVRLAKAKHPEAAVSVRIIDEGARIVILVEDDGAGIDRDKVLNRAITKGLWTAPAGVIDDRQLLDILCLPGFSTRDQVSTVSGRGVGMDAVRQFLSEHHGQIEILRSGPSGTTFRLSWPKEAGLAKAS